MPNLVYRQGPQGYIPSGESSAEQKLANMVQLMQGAPNSVLMMIARILGSGSQAAPQNSETPEGQWQRMYRMPPAIPGVNPNMIRPSIPPQEVVPTMDQFSGMVRG